MSLQPQRVPIGTFRSPQGQDIPVFITLPWFKALAALDTASSVIPVVPVTPGDGAPADGAYVTIGTDATIPNGRALDVDSSLSLSDGGAGSSVILSLAPIGSHQVLANGGASPAEPGGIALTALLDAVFGATQGQLLFRGSAAWSALAPDTAGKVLKTGGAGADPAWGTASGAYSRGATWAAGGVAVSAPANDVAFEFPTTGTITSVTVLGIGGVGSCVVDVWKTNFAGALPTVANSITGSAKPTISSAVKSKDATLTGWTTAVTAGDIGIFHLQSSSTFTAVSVILEITP